MMAMTLTEQDGVVQISLDGRMDLLGVEDVGGPFNARTLQEHGGKMALSGA